MRSLTLGLVVFFMGYGAWAANGENVNDLACEPWEIVAQEYASELTEKQYRRTIQKAHKSIRTFLSTAQQKIETALEEERGFEAIFACATAEEATNGFTQSCLDDNGVEMIPESLRDICLSMHR